MELDGSDVDDDMDLDDILESALDDLDQQEAASSTAVLNSSQPPSGSDTPNQLPEFGPEPPPALNTPSAALPTDLDATMAEFMKELENGDLKTLMSEAEQSPEFKMFMDAINNMEAPAGDGESPASSDAPAGDDSIDATLRMLQEAMEQVEGERVSTGADGLGLPDMSSEEMEQMKALLGNLGENKDFQGYLDKLLSQMMSKEVLQEPMKKIDEKYQEFFVAEADMSTEEEAQYRQQHKFVEEILAEYEKEDSDTERVAQLMQDMQECGQPPPQIVKELAGALGTDGLANIPGLDALTAGDPNAQCLLM